MSSLIPFSFESRDVRFIPEGESFSVIVRDVLLALDYPVSGGVSKYVDHVPDEWKGGTQISTPGGLQDMLTLTEQGFYFFINRSDKPKALPFQKWIAGEVIPAIRKTGGYTLPGAQPQPADPAALAQQLADLLKGGIVVDQAEWTIVRQGIDALREAFGWLDQRVQNIQRASGPPSAPRVRQRPAAPPDPWEPAVRAHVADRQEFTAAEVLRHLGVEDGDQSQNHKNRLAKILKKLGFVVCVVKRGGRVFRIWQRQRHG